MTHVCLDDVSLHFPIPDIKSRSIRAQLHRMLTTPWTASDGSPKVIRALDGVSFELRSGDRLGVMGHNGAGKTTLLRLVSRIYEPTSGTLQVEGSVSSFLDLTAGLDLDATGNENVVLRGRLGNWSRNALAHAHSYVEQISGLGRFLDLPVRTYSSGMLMRLAFALATTEHADILLMDEWLSVGDADYFAVAERRMAELVDAAGIMVLASHSPTFIEKLCTRLLVLKEGRGAFFGPLKEGLAFYQS